MTRQRLQVIDRTHQSLRPVYMSAIDDEVTARIANASVLQCIHTFLTHKLGTNEH